MELFNILVDPNKAKDVCCLCFKNSENLTSVNEYIEIHDEIFDLNVTLENITKNLFPTLELLLPQVCRDCSNLFIKVFSLLQRNYIKKEMLNYLTENLNEEIENVDYNLIYGSKQKKCRLKVDIPCYNNIMNYRKYKDNIKCEKCPMKFNSEQLLKKHTHMTHQDSNNAIICDICGKVFTKNSKLRAHLSSHKQKQCPYCLKYLKSHSYFNLHVRNHKTPVKIKRNVKYLKCNDCDYQSTNKKSLEAHINKAHLHIKPFMCNICEKSFYKKDNLTQHLITHNKVKEKTCDICGETFVIERTLLEHLRIHSGHKPFKCTICGIGFITSGRRHEHMKRKHMEKDECCVICAKKFSLKKDLNTHLKKVHCAETKNFVLKVDLEDVQTNYGVVEVINYKK